MLNRAGLEIRKPPLVITPNYRARHEYADGGDLYVRHGEAPEWRVEVKHIQHDFGVDAFPFPQAFVCEPYTWEHSDPKPWAFFVVNQPMTVVAVISVAATREHWVKGDSYDPRYNRILTTWRCPRNLLRYRELVPAAEPSP